MKVALSSLAAVTASAWFWFAVLCVLATVMGVTGIYVLAGTGWALLAAAACAAAAAAVLRRGLVASE